MGLGLTKRERILKDPGAGYIPKWAAGSQKKKPETPRKKWAADPKTAKGNGIEGRSAVGLAWVEGAAVSCRWGTTGTLALFVAGRQSVPDARRMFIEIMFRGSRVF